MDTAYLYNSIKIKHQRSSLWTLWENNLLAVVLSLNKNNIHFFRSWTKCIKKSALCHKNEGLSISFYGFSFPFHLSPSFLWRHMAYSWDILSSHFPFMVVIRNNTICTSIWYKSRRPMRSHIWFCFWQIWAIQNSSFIIK